MVRNLVGTLVLIGSGEKDINWIDDLLKSKERDKAGKQFPACGLYLINIEYDPKFKIDMRINYPIYH